MNRHELEREVDWKGEGQTGNKVGRKTGVPSSQYVRHTDMKLQKQTNKYPKGCDCWRMTSKVDISPLLACTYINVHLNMYTHPEQRERDLQNHNTTQLA